MKQYTHKAFWFLISAAVLFSSCTVFQNTRIPLEDSVGKGKVKLISVSGDTFIFQKIIIKDDVYYGKMFGKKYKLTYGNDYEVYLYDHVKSTIATVALMIPLVFAGLGLYLGMSGITFF